MSIFYIVKFCKSQTFDIVPYNWVKNNKCSWPNHLKNSDVQNLVKMKKDPEKNWNLYDVEILKAKVGYRKAEKSYNKLKSDGKFDDTCTEEESSEFIKSQRNENRFSSSSSHSEMSDTEIYKELERPSNSKYHSQTSTSNYSLNEETGRPRVVDLNNMDCRTINAEDLQRQNLRFQQRILGLLETIQAEQREIKKMLFHLEDKCVQKQAVDTEEQVSLTSLPSLPVKSEDELLELETCLQNDDIKKRFTKLMGQTGGHEKTGIVRNIMARIISNEVGESYSYTGRKGKKKFKDLTNLNGAIMNAVRMHEMGKDATDAFMFTTIGNWLRYSKNRGCKKNIS